MSALIHDNYNIPNDDVQSGQSVSVKDEEKQLTNSRFEKESRITSQSYILNNILNDISCNFLCTFLTQFWNVIYEAEGI